MTINEFSPPSDERDLVELTQLLRSLTDDEKAVTDALEQIQEEIELLALDAPLRVGNTRQELRSLLNSLEQLAEQLRFEHPLALQLFCAAFRHPIGAPRRLIEQMTTAAKDALRSLESNSPDYGRKVFASQIAKILRDTLKVKPMPTRYDPGIVSGVKGGAAYDRVLRTSLKLAKIKPPNDLRDLMQDGLAILNGDLFGNQI